MPSKNRIATIFLLLAALHVPAAYPQHHLPRLRVAFELQYRPWIKARPPEEHDKVPKEAHQALQGIVAALDEFITFVDFSADGPEYPVLIAQLLCLNPNKGDCREVLWSWGLQLSELPEDQVQSDFSDWIYRPDVDYQTKVRLAPIEELSDDIQRDLRGRLEDHYQDLVARLLARLQILDNALPTVDEKGLLWHLPAKVYELGVSDGTVFRIVANNNDPGDYTCLTEMRTIKPTSPRPDGFSTVTVVQDQTRENVDCLFNHRDLVHGNIILTGEEVYVKALERPALGRRPSSGREGED